MPDTVVDASVLVAVFAGEPGARAAGYELRDGRAFVSSVNLAETATRLRELGVELPVVRGMVRSLGLHVIDFTESHAFSAAELRAPTRHRGLSLGDRACLALAQSLGVPAITMDPAWDDMDVGVDVIVVDREA